MVVVVVVYVIAHLPVDRLSKANGFAYDACQFKFMKNREKKNLEPIF